MKSKLADYNLWYDGSIEVHPDRLEDLIMRGINLSNVYVTEMNQEVQRFNKVSQIKLSIKDGLNKPDVKWILPKEYQEMDFDQYIENNLLQKIAQDEFHEDRLRRLVMEIGEYEKRGLYPILKVLLFIIDTFKREGIIWGVGRGSSCASYLLYLMDLHCVDCVKYNIDPHEFFK